MKIALYATQSGIATLDKIALTDMLDYQELANLTGEKIYRLDAEITEVAKPLVEQSAVVQDGPASLASQDSKPSE